MLFCENVSDGSRPVATGNPNRKQILGVDVRTLKDSHRHRQTLWRRTRHAACHQKPEGEGITEVSYMIPRPGADKTPVAKVTLATRVGDLGCGVGYYK